MGVAAVGPVVAYRHYSRTGSLAGAGPPVVNALAKTAITLIGIAGAKGLQAAAGAAAADSAGGCCLLCLGTCLGCW